MFVHGDNLAQKESHRTKYLDADSRTYLVEIRERYDAWRKANEALSGPTVELDDDDDGVLRERARLLNEYKEFLDQQKYAEKFDSRSNLHSSVIEEFMYYLFMDLVASLSGDALIGKSHSFKDIFFRAPSFKELLDKPHQVVEKKDHDFVIGAYIETDFRSRGSEAWERETLEVPVVAVECKTYLDKTMLEGASMAADQLKARNPNALCLIVAEWLKLTEGINLKKYRVDQIFILRKQKNTDREFRFLEGYEKNPIYPDVVAQLFRTVREHLTVDWTERIRAGIDRGWLL